MTGGSYSYFRMRTVKDLSWGAGTAGARKKAHEPTPAAIRRNTADRSPRRFDGTEVSFMA